MQTTNRTYCPKCNKRNLCSFIGSDGQTKTQCKTLGCQGVLVQKDHAPTTDTKHAHSLQVEYNLPEISYRGISREVCELLGIRIAELDGDTLVSYEHRTIDGGLSVKYRWPDKKFSWNPKLDDTRMFGLDKCTDFTKPLCITEGNEDAASLWEIGFQACSIFSAGSEEENITIDLEYIDLFPEVWICGDNQGAPGKLSREKLKSLLLHKLLREVTFGEYKDANDVLREDPDLLRIYMTMAQEIMPNGISYGSSLDRALYTIPPEPGLKSFSEGLNDAMGGYEYGCMYGLYAGSTTGKTTFLRHEALNLRENNKDLKLVCFFFEESTIITPKAFIALDNSVPLGKLKRDPSIISDEAFNASWDKLINTDNLIFPNKDFLKNTDGLLANIKYLAEVKQFKFFMIDHLSYIIGRTNSSKSGERKDIDKLVYDLQDLCTNLNIIILFACHITDPGGQDSWDAGKVPSLYSGRGSKVLAQAPDGVIALSRNNLDPNSADILKVHCLKSRWDGKLGMTDEFVYISRTGRLIVK